MQRLAHGQRAFERCAPAEVGHIAGVGAGAKDLDRRTRRAGAFQDRTQRCPLPFRGAHRAEAPLLAADGGLEQCATVAGAFDRDRERARRKGADFVDCQREPGAHGAVDDDTVRTIGHGEVRAWRGQTCRVLHGRRRANQHRRHRG